MKACRSCGGTVSDGCTFRFRSPTCDDCDANAKTTPPRNPHIIRRGRVMRADKRRARENPGQLDWVNMVRQVAAGWAFADRNQPEAQNETGPRED